MKNTKEKILQTALKMFAKNGYKAVSVSAIASELNIAKSALYKHYKNKRDIFDSILKKMRQTDYIRAQEYKMPQKAKNQMAQAYENISLEEIKVYSKAQFRYWTEEEFASNFRKLLTLEQYQSQEMSLLYHQYLCRGPFGYVTDLFSSITDQPDKAPMLALSFYASIFALYSFYDDELLKKEETLKMLDTYIDQFTV